MVVDSVLKVRVVLRSIDLRLELVVALRVWKWRVEYSASYCSEMSRNRAIRKIIFPMPDVLFVSYCRMNLDGERESYHAGNASVNFLEPACLPSRQTSCDGSQVDVGCAAMHAGVSLRCSAVVGHEMVMHVTIELLSALDAKCCRGVRPCMFSDLGVQWRGIGDWRWSPPLASCRKQHPNSIAVATMPSSIDD